MSTYLIKFVIKAEIPNTPYPVLLAGYTKTFWCLQPFASAHSETGSVFFFFFKKMVQNHISWANYFYVEVPLQSQQMKANTIMPTLEVPKSCKYSSIKQAYYITWHLKSTEIRFVLVRRLTLADQTCSNLFNFRNNRWQIFEGLNLCSVLTLANQLL